MLHRSGHSLTRRARSAGFSLLEIVIAVAVIAMIAGVVVMRSRSVLDKGRSTKVIELVNTLKKACITYHSDTGQLPWEYSGYDAANRKLSGTQTVAGWQGPYLESPLASTQNPYGGSLHMYATPAVNGNTGFDTDGDGTNDVTASACTLWMSGITQANAQALDAAIDGSLAGTWSSAGKVKWDSTNSYLFILLYW
ncbi:MAG: prepilin-type N-terminal cleavage/methylation domain-containing protein [Planctomycetes bacterium]|nr:prepilin-type N-terminal cleavage/methylation domain-containing protein [Planctomycetota bacterium]